MRELQTFKEQSDFLAHSVYCNVTNVIAFANDWIKDSLIIIM